MTIRVEIRSRNFIVFNKFNTTHLQSKKIDNFGKTCEVK